MRIIEPFTIYQCTLCNTVHTTVASDGTIYEEHLGHHTKLGREFNPNSNPEVLRPRWRYRTGGAAGSPPGRRGTPPFAAD